MYLEQIDVFVRLSAMTIILFVAWLVFRQRRDIGPSAYLFAPLALCLTGFLIGNTPTMGLRLFGFPGELAHFVSGLTVVFLWWFCLSCFDRNFQPRGWVLAIGLLWSVIACMDRGLLGPAFEDKGLSYILITLGFVIVAHLIWHLLSERHGDLIQKRHDARITVAVLLGGQLFIDLSADVIFGLAWRPEAFAMAQNLAILGFGVWFALRILVARPDVLAFNDKQIVVASRMAAASETDSLTSKGAALRQRLETLIDVERVFLEPDLSFNDFVRRMDAPERTVRKLVGHELGFDHFRSFLNHYRMAEARRLLADPNRSDDKLIAIAFDSGFASLASFNRVFRVVEGCTPSQYRETAANNRLPS